MATTPFAYHERTRHLFGRYARSLGHLDWATQPEAFRRFAGARLAHLPRGDWGEPVGYDDLYRGGPAEPSPLTAGAISDLLYHSLAVSAWKAFGGNRWALRANPSSGNLHPTEGYVVLPPVDGISDAPGVYHYAPDEHALEERARLAAGALDGLPEGSFLLGLTSILWREAWKYGERAFRYCQHDLGHAVAALRLAASLRGWRVRLLPGWSHAAAATLLGLDRDGDFPFPEEREEPEAVLLVSPGPADAPDLADATAGAEWTGTANELSGDHHPWPVIAEVADSTRSPGGEWAAGELAGPEQAPTLDRDTGDGRRIIRQRRSGVSFDGKSTTTAESFFRMLTRTMPGRHAPWDAFPWRPRIHLALFVHRVEGLEPGLYVLVREPSAKERLRAATRKRFSWTRAAGAPPDLPLFLLRAGDCRDTAAELSCMQEIAGQSFFSLGMIADFGESLREVGPWFYRPLFWESGMVGQVLYLEAEAEGARGTGIGCYFDDAVHRQLGLQGDGFQSLYHFTIGIAVEDKRLTTLTAYPQARRPGLQRT